MNLYKVLKENGTPHHGGSGTWHLPNGRAGKWMPKLTNIVACERGYHLCREGDLVCWLGPVIYEAEGRGEEIVAVNKMVFGQARLLRRVETWNDTTARLFAADCAERVLPIYEKQHKDDRPRKAIEAARAFARGEISRDELAAAWAAARDAARDAAWNAAWAASDAAWAAARDAADAAWNAADAAWQTERLLSYLRGDVS